MGNPLRQDLLRWCRIFTSVEDSARGNLCRDLRHLVKLERELENFSLLHRQSCRGAFHGSRVNGDMVDFHAVKISDRCALAGSAEDNED